MHPRIIMAIVRKDMLDVLRNRGTLMALLSPLFIAVLYFVKRMSRQHVNELRSMPLDGGEVETPIAHPLNQF